MLILRRGLPVQIPFLLHLAACLLMLVAGVTAFPGRVASAEGGSEAAFFDIDSVATKKLGTARELIVSGRWKDAVELLRQIAESPGPQLVPIDPGRFVAVTAAVNTLLSAVPAEHLEAYRDRIDPLARRWYELGVSRGEDDYLQRLVDRTFHSRHTDLALLTLGDRALERGEFARARRYWEALIPPFPAEAPERLIPPLPYYPHPRMPVSMVQARLILSRICESDATRARRDLRLFRKWHPEAEGSLAGTTGNLADILESLLATVETGLQGRTASDESTFAGSAARTLAARDPVDVGAVRWKVPLTEIVVETPEVADPFERPFGGNPFPRNRDRRVFTAFPTFPVIHENLVFCADESHIFAYDLLARDEPRGAWGASPVVYELADAPRMHPRDTRGRIGMPARTVSIAGGRLIARLGRAVAARGASAVFAGPPSTLVCLDLQREGAVTWRITAEQFAEDAGNWVFDGCPLAHGGRIYVLLRKTAPQLTLNVVCLSPETGEVLWNRRLCHGLEPFSVDYDEIHEQLLTVADGRIFVCTNLGVVAAVDARDGAVVWACTYPRIEIESVASLHDRQRLGPNPCVYSNGTVFAVPFDSNAVVAFDAESGLPLWSRVLPGNARQIVGVDGDRLVVAGSQLWGLVPETGEVAWSVGSSEPQAATQGRGVLAGGLVYWPRRDEILLVESATGRRRRDVALTAQHELPGGGNLAIGEGFLVVAQSNRLVAFWEYANRKRRLEDEAEKQPLSALPHFRLGLQAEAQGEFQAAGYRYLQALEKVSGKDRWYGRSLFAVLRERFAPLALSAGRESLAAAAFEESARVSGSAALLAPRWDDRASALLVEAEARMLAGDTARAAKLYHQLEYHPELRRLPRDGGTETTVGRVAERIMARAGGLGETPFNDALTGLAVEQCDAAAATGSPRTVLRVAAQYPLAPALERSLERYANVAVRQGDWATAAAVWQQLAAGGREESTRQTAFSALMKIAEEKQHGKDVRDRERLADSVEDLAVAREESAFSRFGPGSRRWRVDNVDAERVFAPTVPAAGPAPDWVVACGRDMACFRRTDGRHLWSMPLAESVTWVGGNEDTVLLATGSLLCAFAVTDGAVRWWRATCSVPADPESGIRGLSNEDSVTPVRFELVGDTVLVLDAPQTLTAVQVSTGEPKWTYRTGINPARMTARDRGDVAGQPFRQRGGDLQPWWGSRGNWVAVQSRAPSETLFFDVDDGFSHAAQTPVGHDWIADPVMPAGGEVWGVGVCTGTIHQLDPRQGRVEPLQDRQRYDGVRPALLPGDLPLGVGESFLALRDRTSLELRSTATGRAIWQRAMEWGDASQFALAIGPSHLFAWSRDVVRCYALKDGQIVWEQPLSAAPGERSLAITGQALLAWPTRTGRSSAMSCLALADGDIMERWRLGGPAGRERVVRSGSDLIVHSDDTLSLIQLEAPPGS